MPTRIRTSMRAALATTVLALALGVLAAPGAGALETVATEPVAATPALRLAYVTATVHSSPAVWVAQGNGSEPKRLGPGDEPLLAPNGQSVAASVFGAVADSEHGPALAVYSTVGGAPADYLNLATATATPLAWSPDSRYLAVAVQSTAVTNPGQGSGLAVIDTSTGTVEMIAHGLIYGASFAPEGSDAIAYAIAPSQSFSAPVNIFISQADGSAQRPLTNDGRSLNPVWGPRYIAYDRERLRPGYAPLYQIWLQSPSATRAHKLTNVPVQRLVSGLVPIAFSSDGSRLLAEFGGEDTSEAWTVRVLSGRARRLLVHGRSVIAAGISRDGRTVLVDEGSFEGPDSNGRVASVPFAGGRSKVLIAHGAQASWNG